MSNTGALIVATPLEGDPIHEYGAEPDPHVSMLWFGDASALPPELTAELQAAVANVAAEFGPFQASVSGRALLGTDGASVLLLEAEELVEIRSLLALNDSVQQAWAMAEKQFPWWVCHLTTAYDGALPVDPPDAVSIGQLDLWLGEARSSFPLVEEDVNGGSVMVPTVASLDDLAPALQYADQHPAARWYTERRAHALGAPELIPTGWAVSS